MDQRYLFYGERDLRGFAYKLVMRDSYGISERRGLSTRITRLGGTVTFTTSHSTVIVIESKQLMQSNHFEAEMRDFDKVILHSEGTVQTLKNLGKEDRNSRIMRIIYIKDLIDQLDLLESYSIDAHFQYGLPNNVNKEATISNVNIRERKLKFFQFNKLSYFYRNTLPAWLGDLEYSIPFYNPNVPQGFSMFNNQDEIDIMVNYIKNHGSKVNIESEKITTYPQMRKENNFCNICGQRIEDYVAHIKSQQHKTNIERNNSVYNKIQTCFDKIQMRLQEEKNKQVEMDNSARNANLSTKFDTSNVIQSTCNQNPEVSVNKIQPSVLLEKESEIEENKENISILNNTKNNQSNSFNNKEKLIPVSLSEKSNIPGHIRSQNNILIEHQPEQNKLQTTISTMFKSKKRKFSEMNFREVEKDLTKRSQRMMMRNAIFKKNKEFSKAAENLEKMNELIEKSIGYNIK